MKKENCYTKGFTLIEILVVVVIIAVLAAIAVPAYQKAVLKSRFSSLMPTTKAIRDGQEMYYMTNGRYANAVNKLDATATNNSGMTITLSDDSDYAYTMATRPNINNNLIMYQKHSVNFPGEIHCEALTGNTGAEWLCETGLKAVQNLGENITPNYTTYVLEGTGMGIPYWAKDIDCDKAESMGLSCQAVRNALGVGRQMCMKGACRTIYENEDGGYTSVTCSGYDGNVCKGFWYSVTYDANGKMLTYRKCANSASIDSSGNCTKYDNYEAYDYTYDANGNQLTYRKCESVDSSGKCTSYANSRVEYTYDANGNMLTQRTCSSVNNSNGKCNGYDTRAKNMDYTYDANGNKLTQRRCSSVNSNGTCNYYSSSDAYDYTYDANGNQLTNRSCKSVNSSGKCTSYANSRVEYTYDANGNMLTQRTCNSVNSSGNCTEYSRGYNYTYDANGNKLTERYCSSVDTSGNCTAYNAGNNANYTYDANGNMLSVRHCSSVDSSGNCTEYAIYDWKKTYDYTYDANGNMLTERVCSSVDSSGKCTSYNTSFLYDYTYDANGNMLTKRQCQSVDSDGNCNGGYIRWGGNYDYIYDDNGNEIANRDCGGSINQSTGECSSYYSNNLSVK